MGPLARRQALEASPQGFEAVGRGHLARKLSAGSVRRTRTARPAHPRRMSGCRTNGSAPIPRPASRSHLSRASSADAARAQEDHRRRRRHEARLHAHPAPRNRPRHPERFPLQRRRRWQELFGNSSTRYPSFYRPNPASKNYVQHLRLWYGQSHPDEDFAETFAVWLKPRSDWRRRYAGWPALRKLEYVDEVMAEIAGQRAPTTRGAAVHPLSQITTTLAQHYAKKQALYAVETPRTYAGVAPASFERSEAPPFADRALSFIRRNRSHFRQTVARWTGEYQLTLNSVLDDMIDRCRELQLSGCQPRSGDCAPTSPYC